MGKKSKEVSIIRIVVTSFLVDVSDVVLNLIVVVLTGSVVVLTQVVQGVADLTASALTVVGVLRSRLPASKKHPFGHGREVYFWAMLSGIVLFSLSAVFAFKVSYDRFLNPEKINNILLAGGVLLVGFVTNSYALSLSVKKLIRNKGWSRLPEAFAGSTLIETKTALIQDLTGSLSSALGLLALMMYKLTGDLRFDGLGGMVISVLMALLAVMLLINVHDLIIGRSASKTKENEIAKTVLAIKGVISIVDLRTLVIGSEKIMVHLEVNVEGGLKTAQIEKLIDEIQMKVKRKVPVSELIQVEIETPDKGTISSS